ncbi:glycosyltransferase family 4 protein [Candidatus Beckwithbacteria bacterium]|nr:glycosyltransferase family 4 protein [Candidatus Beckwithbacteria bacterium]
MKIGLDCRFWGITHAGLGRYTRELVLALLNKYQDKADFTLFINRHQWQEDKALLKNCHLVETEIPHYSLKEQLQFGGVIDKEKLDLMHFMHFNVPVLAKTPYIVTIHDLIKHFFKGKPVTTRSSLVYWLKYGGYRLTIGQAIKRSECIITPSLFTKDQVAVHYPLAKDKIRVVYEGVSEPYNLNLTLESAASKKIQKKYQLNAPYFVYTGSAYPSKNLEVLLEALKQFKAQNNKVQLLIACARNVFWQRLKDQIAKYKLENYIVMPGNVPDEELKFLYAQARAYVFPSLMEGFGLPGLEAMASACPVISSNTGSLPEIYGSNAWYFDPHNSQQLFELMQQAMNLGDKQRNKIVEKGMKYSKTYTWEKAAAQTWQVYQEVF